MTLRRHRSPYCGSCPPDPVLDVGTATRTVDVATVE